MVLVPSAAAASQHSRSGSGSRAEARSIATTHSSLSRFLQKLQQSKNEEEEKMPTEGVRQGKKGYLLTPLHPTEPCPFSEHSAKDDGRPAEILKTPRRMRSSKIDENPPETIRSRYSPLLEETATSAGFDSASIFPPL